MIQDSSKSGSKKICIKFVYMQRKITHLTNSDFMAESTKTKKDALAAHLRRAILTTELAPGADIDESALCAEFGLSRTPLRDVFRDLAGEGYLSLHLNRGVRVAELSHGTLRAFFQAATLVYSAVLQLAAEDATSSQIDALKSAQLDFKASLRSNDIAARALANNFFHEVTGEMAANPYLLPSFQRLLIDHARISMTFYHPQTEDMRQKLVEASAQHDAIIEAIENRDTARAGQLAMEHWQLSRSEIERFVMPAGLKAPQISGLGKRTA